jgi:hypothetical protein
MKYSESLKGSLSKWFCNEFNIGEDEAHNNFDPIEAKNYQLFLK